MIELHYTAWDPMSREKPSGHLHSVPPPTPHIYSILLAVPAPRPTRLVCLHALEQYCSVRLAQGVGGPRRVSPGLLTMLRQRRCRRGAQSLVGSTGRILPLAPPHPGP